MRPAMSVAAVALALALTVAPAARAVPVALKDGDHIFYADEDGAGTPQELTIETPAADPNTGPYRLTDARSPMVAGAGCVQLTLNSVECAGYQTFLTVETKGQDDRLETKGAARCDYCTGGDGADVFVGSDGGGFYEAWGGPGNDVFRPGAYPRQTVHGEAGDDYFEDRGFSVGTHIRSWERSDPPGADRGHDVIDYSARTNPLNIADNGQSSGERGEGDNIEPFHDVDFLAGSGDDRLISTYHGAGTSQRLFGGGGDDYLLPGTGAANEVWGGPGTGDRAVYTGRTAPVFVYLNELPDDGEPGESDNVHGDVEELRGGSSDDKLIGNSGANILRGDAGNDYLEPLGGSDQVFGGAGTGDRVDYQASTGPVFVFLNGIADDGQPGENDSIASDVEELRGGAFDDKLIGNSGANILRGRAGDDYLEPLGGADQVFGGDGSGDRVTYAQQPGPVNVSLDGAANDGASGEGDSIADDVEELRGTPLGDTLTGNGLPNVLRGLGGADTLDPRGGADTVDAGEGDDSVTTADGAVDKVACGAGIDSAIADLSDQLAADCESRSTP
jgi:hypothetical protein